MIVRGHVYRAFAMTTITNCSVTRTSPPSLLSSDPTVASMNPTTELEPVPYDISPGSKAWTVGAVLGPILGIALVVAAQISLRSKSKRQAIDILHIPATQLASQATCVQALQGRDEEKSLPGRVEPRELEAVQPIREINGRPWKLACYVIGSRKIFRSLLFLKDLAFTEEVMLFLCVKAFFLGDIVLKPNSGRINAV